MSIMKTTDSATRIRTHILTGSERNRSRTDLRLAGGSFILIYTSLQHHRATIHEDPITSLQRGPPLATSSPPQTRRPSFASLHSKPSLARGQSMPDRSFAFQWPPMLKFSQSGGAPRLSYLKKQRG